MKGRASASRGNPSGRIPPFTATTCSPSSIISRRPLPSTWRSCWKIPGRKPTRNLRRPIICPRPGISAPIRELKRDRNDNPLPPAYDYDDEPKSDTARRAETFAERYADPAVQAEEPARRETPDLFAQRPAEPPRREEPRPEPFIRAEEPLSEPAEEAPSGADLAEEAPEETNIPPC